MNLHAGTCSQVRKAFCAAPGKKLIVADYGQLELRYPGCGHADTPRCYVHAG